MRSLIIGLQLISMVASAAISINARSVAEDLQNLVSTSSVAVEVRERWSDFDVPLPSVIVNATSEKDLSAVVGAPTFSAASDHPLLCTC